MLKTHVCYIYIVFNFSVFYDFYFIFLRHFSLILFFYFFVLLYFQQLYLLPISRHVYKIQDDKILKQQHFFLMQIFDDDYNFRFYEDENHVILDINFF